MGGRKFKLSVLRKNCDRKRHTLQSTSECSSLDTLRHLLEGANDAIPTGWLLVSDEYSQLVLVKLTTQGLEATGAKVMYSIAVHDDLTYSIHVREKPMH